MKKITLSFFVFLISLVAIDAQVVNFDASKQCPDPQTDPVTPCWGGFMNVFNLPAPAGDGVKQFESSWGINDLVSQFSATQVTLLPNRIGDTNAYWQTDGEMEGEKYMEANLFVTNDGGLQTSESFSFTGEVVSNTLLDMPQTISYNGTGSDQGDQALNVPYISRAFIKIFNSDYTVLLYEAYAPLSVGTFSVAYDGSIVEDASNNVQYGFQVIGPNINSRSEFDEYYNQIGSIVVEAAVLSTDSFESTSFVVSNNPTSDSWELKSSNVSIETIELYDILGKKVQKLTPNNTEVSIDASQLRSGIYLAKIATDLGSKTIKLVKQ